MNLTVIGGSSFSTPSLFLHLAPRLGAEQLHVTLVGRSRERTNSVERAVKFVTEGAPISVKCAGMSPTELVEALRGADLVLLQVRPGGLEARAFDEVFPHKYGLPGDEGLGVSGLRSAWRAWPCVQPILAAIAEVCPGALVTFLTSPLGILTRATRTCFPKLNIAPICELPWTTLKKIAIQTGEPAHKIDFDYIGINHLGWFHRLVAGSRNLLEELPALQEGKGSFPSGELIRDCSAFPTSYLRMHYFPQDVLKEQQCQSQSRGAVLQKLSTSVMDTYQNGAQKDVVASLNLRSTPWYEHAVGPMIISLCAGQPPPPLFLSVANNGHEQGIPDTDTLEVAHYFRSGAFVPRKSVAKAPQQIVDLLIRFLAFEREATEAVLQRDPAKVENALRGHPWIGDSLVTEEMVRDVVVNNALQ